MIKRHHVYQRIAENLPQMSRSHAKIARYILQNPYTVPFFTVAKLAKMTDVSEATVVRFATSLGYTGYPDLQQHMMESVEKQLTAAERLELSMDVYSKEEKGIYEIFQDDIANLKSTMENLDISAFYRASEALINARKVYIVASRSAASLGIFLRYYLDLMLGNTEFVQSAYSIFEQLFKVTKNDVVFGISFSRYARSTIDIVSYAKKKNATTIAVTDNYLSPLVPHADISFYASSQMPSFSDSFVAPFSLINALITYVGKQKQDDFHLRLSELEEVWEQFNVYYQKERKQ